jgi:antitoxin component of MazEF toxin-antitoxin module
MLSGTFVGEITNKKNIEIPSEMLKRLQLSEGDKVEVMVKRIRSRRLDIKISKNPLLKLLSLSEDEHIL